MKQWIDDADLKKQLQEDFKANNLKVSIRRPRAGYLTAMDFTIKVSKEDLLTQAESGLSKQDYDNAMYNFEYSNGYHTYPGLDGHYNNECPIVKKEINEKMRKVFEIVDSYNYDNSDSMTDYFDRGIYDDYFLKLA